MTTNILLLIGLIIIFQLVIGHFWHDIGYSYKHSIGLMCLPLGIGLFIEQVFFYERHYPKWHVPFKTKLKLKYMYIATFLEYVAVYFCLFIF